MVKSEFEKLVMRVRPSMLDLCRGFLNANRLPDAPEDVVQDALLRLWGMKDRLQPESHPEAVALRIAKNLCIDCYRRRVLDSVSVESVAPMDSLQILLSTTKDLEEVLVQVMEKLVVKVTKAKTLEAVVELDLASKADKCHLLDEFQNEDSQTIGRKFILLSMLAN